jgi:hypothetical protein
MPVGSSRREASREAIAPSTAANREAQPPALHQNLSTRDPPGPEGAFTREAKPPKISEPLHTHEAPNSKGDFHSDIASPLTITDEVLSPHVAAIPTCHVIQTQPLPPQFQIFYGDTVYQDYKCRRGLQGHIYILTASSSPYTHVAHDMPPAFHK